MAVVFLVVEVLCVLLIALGVGWAVHPGWGCAVGGALGLVLVVVAQLPPKGDR